MNSVSPPKYERCLAVDLHKYYVVIGGLNARQEVVLPLRRMDLTDWPEWAEAGLIKERASSLPTMIPFLFLAVNGCEC